MPPVAPYQAYRNRLVSASDRLWAETVKIVFVKGGQADPAKAQLEITAPLRTAGQTTQNMDGGRARGWGVDIAAGTAMLFIDQVAWPDLGLSAGDRIQALARPGQPWFEITRLGDRSHDRLTIHLTEM